MKQEVTSVKTVLRDTGSSLLYTCHSFSLMSISWKHNVQAPCDATCHLQNAAHKAGWISFRLYLVFHGEEASSADSFQRECLNERPLLHHEHVKPLHVSWNGQKLSEYPNHNRLYMMQCNIIVSVNNQELETWEWNMTTFTLRAVGDTDTVAVLHHGDKTGDFEFLCCLLVLILGAHKGK